MDLEEGRFEHESEPLVLQTTTRKGQDIRLAGIQRIQRDMTTVNQLFKDLSTIVISQGDSITAIDASVEKAVEHSRKATEEVAKTDKRHRQQQSFAFRLIGILLMFVLSLFLIRTFIFRS
jgi:t-SNARE complex subunit (syntaxin)